MNRMGTTGWDSCDVKVLTSGDEGHATGRNNHAGDGLLRGGGRVVWCFDFGEGPCQVPTSGTSPGRLVAAAHVPGITVRRAQYWQASTRRWRALGHGPFSDLMQVGRT